MFVTGFEMGRICNPGSYGVRPSSCVAQAGKEWTHDQRAERCSKGNVAVLQGLQRRKDSRKEAVSVEQSMHLSHMLLRNEPPVCTERAS